MWKWVNAPFPLSKSNPVTCTHLQERSPNGNQVNDNTRVLADSLEAAEEARLRYVSDDQPGGSLYPATRTASANFPGISRCQSIKCGNRRTSFSLNLRASSVTPCLEASQSVGVAQHPSDEIHRFVVVAPEHHHQVVDCVVDSSVEKAGTREYGGWH